MPVTKARISGRLFSRRGSDITIILRFGPIRPPFRLTVVGKGGPDNPAPIQLLDAHISQHCQPIRRLVLLLNHGDTVQVIHGVLQRDHELSRAMAVA